MTSLMGLPSREGGHRPGARLRLHWLLLCAALWSGVSVSCLAQECPDPGSTVSTEELPDVYYYDTRGAAPKTCGRLPQRWLGSMPCSCEDYTCGCCAGIRMQIYSVDHRACMNLTYDPYEFSVTADMIVDDKSVYKNSISGKNPPPLCMQLPISYVPPFSLLPPVDFCVKFFEIFTPGRNLHLCVDFMLRMDRASLLVLHFDCVRAGVDGVSLLKPGEEGAGAQPGEPPIRPPTGPEHEVPYDEVTEDRAGAASTPRR